MINKLILGTAQFGLNYGINNNNGQLEKDQVLELLNVAYQGIRFLDTAEIYGNAHNIIGDFHKRNENLRFKIITKFPHNFNIDVINDKVFEYINVLNITVIDVLMFHSFNSFKSNYQSVELLEELKRSGHINHIGVSVYTNNQLESLLNEDLISVVQLPFNLLDNINVRGDLLEKLKNKGKSVHVRSVFLQGLFFKNINDKTPIVKQLKTELKLLNHLTSKFKCSMEELALSYNLSQQNIDNVIIGVDSIFQLNNNIKASFYKLQEETIQHINKIHVKNLELLNPSLWN